MTKDELIKDVACKTGITVKESKNIIQTVFDMMSESLSKGQKVKITGFGTFKVKKRGGFKACNPMTGDILNIPEYVQPVFEASKKLKEKVNQSNET